MRSPPTHDFQEAREFHLDLQARSFLALVDLESYPGFVAEKADRLDLLQHLCHEMDALTATMWEVPDATLRLHFIWTPDDDSRTDRFPKGDHHALANGVVRSTGRLCLANDEQLLHRARNRRGDLLRAGGKRHSHLLLVPSGVYEIAIYGASSRKPDGAAIEYTVLLVYHPHPGPRLHPVRINGLMPFGRTARPLDHPEATPDWCDSHKAPR